MRGVQSLSAITAALRDEEEESDDGGPMDEDTALEDVDNPRWQLFETIKSATNNQGTARLCCPCSRERAAAIFNF
jgi:protein polybromo-1